MNAPKSCEEYKGDHRCCPWCGPTEAQWWADDDE